MKLTIPHPDEIIALARSLHMSFSHEDAVRYGAMMAGIFDAYRLVDEAVETLPVVTYPRTPGRRPPAEENTHGAWTRRLELRGRAEGPLAGHTLALKDIVMLAGVPMNAGTRFFDGFVPEVDATVVTRLLDAGVTIVGKTVCEYVCLSGGSHTGYPAPVLNPWNTEYSAGGSSSGSAVAVARGEATMALGTDQGGSIRIPASWCGIVGLKPTYGLVPYTGILPIEHTLDHIGPMTRTVRDNALLLTAMAGPDPFDPRQHPGIRGQDYTNGIELGIAGKRIGIVREGFGFDVSEPASDALVRQEAERLATLGAIVEEVSIPVHRMARSLWTPLFIEGCLQLMMRTNGAGSNHAGLYLTSASDAFARWRDHADEFSPSLKVTLLAAAHFERAYRGRFYGRSQNLMREVRAAYDRVLETFDLLVMPTTPHKAQKLPGRDAGEAEIWEAALGMNINTAPFCSTGHPAISVPCGAIDGLPVGMMLVGRHFDERTVYRAAHAYETSGERLPRLEGAA